VRTLVRQHDYLAFTHAARGLEILSTTHDLIVKKRSSQDCGENNRFLVFLIASCIM